MTPLRCISWSTVRLSVNRSSNPMSTSRFVLLSALMLTSSRSIAEQPIFGEMPRWAGGWGVQTRHEARRDGETDSQWLHVDGVYTWERWIRVTAKVPFRIDESMGIGTPTLALPLKRYFNLDGRSGSWTLAPQWFVPIANPNSSERSRADWRSLRVTRPTHQTHSHWARSVPTRRRLA